MASSTFTARLVCVYENENVGLDNVIKCKSPITIHFLRRVHLHFTSTLALVVSFCFLSFHEALCNLETKFSKDFLHCNDCFQLKRSSTVLLNCANSQQSRTRKFHYFSPYFVFTERGMKRQNFFSSLSLTCTEINFNCSHTERNWDKSMQYDNDKLKSD